MSVTALKSTFLTTSFSVAIRDRRLNRWSVIAGRRLFSTYAIRPTENDRSPENFVAKSDR